MDAGVALPDLGADRLPREHRSAEAAGNAAQPGSVVAATRAKDRVAGDTVRPEPMQDRPREAGPRGSNRVGVERVPVAREAVQERRLWHGPQIADSIGQFVRNRRRRLRLRITRREAAVATAEVGMRDDGDRPAGLVADRPFLVDDRASTGALVDDRRDTCAADHGALDRERPE